MKIKTLEVAGFEPAFTAMRNPLNSWARGDSCLNGDGNYAIGENDRQLSQKLADFGPEHAKHLRMIMAWADITAPRYWWNEFDTYRIGVEKVSCSTMHKLMAKPLTIYDFENDSFPLIEMHEIINSINARMKQYEAASEPEVRKEIWRGIIQTLPQSYLQKRTVMMSYAALRNIYRQREGHKLKEWEQFMKWADSLPGSWMITMKGGKSDGKQE